jgi:hypothetical protein
METTAPKKRLSIEEENAVVAAIARDVVRLEDRWTRGPRSVAGSTVDPPELRAAFAKVMRNVGERLSG